MGRRQRNPIADCARIDFRYTPEDLQFIPAAATAVVAISMLASQGDARADVLVRIDKSSQSMSVIVNGQHRHTWVVSTGIYGTPSGTFRRSRSRTPSLNTL